MTILSVLVYFRAGIQYYTTRDKRSPNRAWNNKLDIIKSLKKWFPVLYNGWFSICNDISWNIIYYSSSCGKDSCINTLYDNNWK